METATTRALLGLGNDLTDPELLALTDSGNRPGLKKFLAACASSRADNTYVTALSDAEVAAQFPQFVEATAKWRAYATAVGYTGPVAWRVKAGFSLRAHAPKAGPCFQNFKYLQDWRLKNDEPTINSLVFWVPRLAEGSLNKTASEMAALRADLRKKHGLHQHHGTSFGSAALIHALILAHFQRTGERVPLRFNYAATDTFHEVGSRLVAGYFSEDGLYCGGWCDLHGRSYVGCFLLGVEDLGG